MGPSLFPGPRPSHGSNRLREALRRGLAVKRRLGLGEFGMNLTLTLNPKPLGFSVSGAGCAWAPKHLLRLTAC